MKKFLLLFFIVAIFQTSISAQSLQLMKADGSSINNDTIQISTMNDSSAIVVPVYVKNISNKSIDVLVKVYIKSIVDGSGASFCWGSSCFDIYTTSPESYTTINTLDTAKEFHSDLEPKKNYGTSEIMFTFFNKNNFNDSISITLNYEVIENLTSNITRISDAKKITSFPNPVKDIINFNFDIEKQNKGVINIYDLTGKIVKQEEVSTSENFSKINVSDLASGIYIWAIKVGGISIKTEKFIKR